jgi:hypothetical protein
MNLLPAPEPINLREKFSRFSDYWSPKIVGEHKLGWSGRIKRTRHFFFYRLLHV